MSDKPKPRIGTHWKRPPTKVYDYNYDVGQHYYKPMINHLEKKDAGMSSESPGPKTFAERLAEDPLYGRSKPVNYVTSDYSPSSPRNGGSEGFSSRRAGLDFHSDSLFKDRDDDKANRSRPNGTSFNLPSISDQILDHAGMKLTGDNIFDEALADLKSKRRQTGSDFEEFPKDAANSVTNSNSEELFNKRRNMLRDIDSELEKLDSGLEKYSSSRAKTLNNWNDDILMDSAKLSSSSLSSLNVKKRSLKTTVTTETVRY